MTSHISSISPVIAIHMNGFRDSIFIQFSVVGSVFRGWSRSDCGRHSSINGTGVG